MMSLNQVKGQQGGWEGAHIQQSGFEAFNSLHAGLSLPSENPSGGLDIITEGEEGVQPLPHPSLR